VSYPAAFAELTAATARLLAADPAQAAAEPLPAAEASRLLAARDAVVGEVRTLAGLLTGPSAGAGAPGLAQLIDDPAHVLADALRALPTVAPSRAPSDLLGVGEDAWAVAGRAAVALEAQHDAVWELSGAGAWSALRDVAELATAVPLLDADLAGRLPTAWVEARRQLADPVTHGLVRLAADELRTQLHGQSQEPYLEQLDRPPPRPTLLRDPAQLPEGMRRLAAVLDDVGPTVAAADVRSVTGLLALGVELTERRARAAGQSGAADVLTAMTPGLRRLAAANVAALSPPDARLRMLTSEVYGQLRRLQGRPGAAALPAALGWVRAAPAVAAALTGAAEASARDGWLLIRRAVETRQSTSLRSNLSWLPVTSAADLQRHPLLTELRATRDALAAARPALDQALAAVAPPAADAAVRRAALAAGRAGAELRAALNARRGSPSAATADLPAHPMLRVKPAARLPGQRL